MEYGVEIYRWCQRTIICTYDLILIIMTFQIYVFLVEYIVANFSINYCIWIYVNNILLIIILQQIKQY